MRAPSVDNNGMKKGSWSKEEDSKLRAYILRYGHWNWRLLPKFAGLARCGKSCRLRWVNYLKPGLKRGNYTNEEQDLITKLHHQFGNKWSAIAAKLPGRTDNEIKNYWHTHLKKRSQSVRQMVCKNSKEVQNLEGFDIPILESLGSESCPMNSDSEESSTSSSHSILEGSNFLCEKVAETSNAFFQDEGESSLGSFWTEPFLVDTDSYIQTESFPFLFDEGDFFSGYVFT